MTFKKQFFSLLRKGVLYIENRFDKYYLHPEVPTPKVVKENWLDYVYNIGNKPGTRILEVGSREVTGKSTARERLSKAEYIGFDFYEGNNVDVVGDAHKLSTYFKPEEKFDIIYSSACFEHFAMPWIVAQEIAKLLKVGGVVVVATHFSYSAHERPWNFFQFSDMGLKVLFSTEMGFECIDSGMYNPMVGRFSSFAEKYLRNEPVRGLYCSSSYMGKKVKNVDDFDWNKVNLTKLVSNTKYPNPKN